MFASYAALHLWQNVQLEDDSLASFIKERLKNYALSTVEEFYLNSELGILLPDESLWLAFGGGYPQRGEHSWLERNVDKTMTSAQMGFELLALLRAVQVEDKPEVKDKLQQIIEQKLFFLQQWIDRLPHQWKLEEGGIEAGEDEATLYDSAALLLAMMELRKAGFANVEEMIGKLGAMLTELDNDEFNADKIKEELLYILALIEFGNKEQAKKKIEKLEELYAKGELGLDSLYLYALASYVDYKVGGTLFSTIFADMKEKYYLSNISIFAETDTEFTHKITLESLGPLLLSFEPEFVNNKEFIGVTLYRMIEEAGLFLKQRNILVERTPLTMIKNYPFTEEMLPILSFNKGRGDLAPVFTEEVIVHSAYMKPYGNNLMPFSFAKVFSPNYQYNTSDITALSYGLQFLGRRLNRNDERIVIEEGRSLDEHGRKYLESLLESGAGIEIEGNTLLPFETLALKGAKHAEFNFEPLNTSDEFDTETLANLLLAEKLYIEGGGNKKVKVAAVVEAQRRIVDEFRAFGYIPARFKIFMESDGRVASLIPSQEKARKEAIAKLFYVLGDDFLREALEKGEGTLIPEDFIFLAMAPEMAAYFEDDIREFMETKASTLSSLAAEVIIKMLAGRDRGETLSKLLDLWDEEIELPRAERMETIAQGSVLHYDPQHIILYLLAIQGNPKLKFRRTLDFFTGLLEGEWGVNWEQAIRALPATEYWLLKELPKENIEPGDLLTLRARVENRCPVALMRAHDLPSLFLRADFVPPLIYAGTEHLDELTFFRDFLWGYENFFEGDVLEYIYQAIIPQDIRDNFIEGIYIARGYTGYQPFDPDSASGEYCEAIYAIDKLPIMPLEEITGLVFEDVNVNGRRDAGERGIPGIMIKDTRGRIYRSNTEGRFVVFAGDELIGIQIELKSVPSHFIFTTAPTQIINRQFEGVISFGLIPCITVRGFVFRDENSNGIYDEGEQKIKGIVLQAQDKEVISSDDGQFIFRNLPIFWKEQVSLNSEQPYFTESMEGIKVLIEQE